ncbi:MAG: heavy metal translocating P-type ATPase [Phyllobacteriaceae bacterium]|nr:heavy metal translocating P-type ATPase [Phyllobacteriaceae bacterium]
MTTPETPHDLDWDAFATPGVDGRLHMDLAVEGITCAACMSTIERGLKQLDGVAGARVNLTTRRLAVDWAPETVKAGAIVRRLERLGYRAHPFDPGRLTAEEEAESKELLRCMGAAGFGAMNIMLLSVSVWAGNVTDIDPATRDLFHWISALIAIPIVAYSGRPFFRSAVRALAAFRTNMDVPISIGVVLTLALSIFETMRSSREAFFDSVVMLLFFLLVGRFLDQNMRRRTRSVAENIAALRVEAAALIRADGVVQEVPLSKIDPGALVLVRPGERVSVDGVVEEGTSDIDQSLITGETDLVQVGPGDRVYAGTLDVGGTLRVRVTAAAAGTLLDEVNRLLEAAAQAKSKYMRLADRAARLYAPVVHSSALLTFLGWWLFGGRDVAEAGIVAVSVLIITCPCALALAIPAVQVVTSGILFRSGVLLHSGDAIERLASVDTVVFDKTGTLTLPEARLLNAADVSVERLMAAGRLARASRHPLGVALAEATRAVAAPIEVREIPGRGIETVASPVERLGSPEFCGVAADEVARFAARFPGASLVAHRDGDGDVVVCALRQGRREDAGAVIAALRAGGWAVEILSGDREAAVAAIAADLGVERWSAGVRPADKIARIEALKADGRKVLMVGDGLNDAPALAAATVSLSPVTGVHLSQAAADAVFLGDRLVPVLAALRVSRRAKAAMIQNLGLSVVYNAVAVPIAVAGHITPLIAAIAMSGSSILVTVNALRLRLGADVRDEGGREAR